MRTYNAGIKYLRNCTLIKTNMKNKSLGLGLLGLMAVTTACNDEPSEISPENDGVISFSAVTPNGSRAASTTTATMKEFVVYGFTEGATLMDGVKVVRNGGSWTYEPEAYWPVSPVNFYAFSPDITNSPDLGGMNGGNIPNYLSPGNVDLLYSVKTGVTNQVAPVLLNFRHALSRVSVMLSSTNQRITVKVHNVLLSNFYMQGTFNFPTSSTLASTPDVVGSWSMLKKFGNNLLFYALGPEDVVTLTPVPTDYTEGTLDYSFVIPQPISDVVFENSEYSGTFIQVDCEIFDTATGAKLWPNTKTPDYMLVRETECGRIVYPTTSDNIKSWLPGHAYIYNIEINNPDVLDKIKFDVSVDDFSIDEM